jgi:hypothetical protein
LNLSKKSIVLYVYLKYRINKILKIRFRKINMKQNGQWMILASPLILPAIWFFLFNFCLNFCTFYFELSIKFLIISIQTTIFFVKVENEPNCFRLKRKSLYVQEFFFSQNYGFVINMFLSDLNLRALFSKTTL